MGSYWMAYEGLKQIAALLTLLHDHSGKEQIIGGRCYRDGSKYQ